MLLRSLVEPEEFSALESAFAEAWASIERSQVLDPLRVPAQRERLAHIIVGLWKGGGISIADLAVRAEDQFMSVMNETNIPEGRADPIVPQREDSEDS